MSRHFDSVIEPADAPEPDAPMTDELIDEFYLNLFWEPDYECLPEIE